MLRPVLGTAILLLSSAATAQVATPPSAAADAAAAPIIVTATRTPMPVDRVAASVTVLDKAAIDRSQDIGVTELLVRTPGVSISRTGGYGTATSLRIRGAETDQTVVVIDGVKLNDPSAVGGGYNFGNLLVGDAARIEVLRGPQSVLWGSQAIGGVVNIVTPLPAGPLGGSLDLEGGSRATVNARAAIGGKTGSVTWRLGGTSFTTDGISAIAPAYGGIERDGYTNQTATGRLEIAIAPAIQIDLRGYYSYGNVDLDGFNVDSADSSTNAEYVGYGGVNFDLLGGRLRNRIGYGLTDTRHRNYGPSRARLLSFDAAGRNRRLEYQGSLAIADRWAATFGAENERSRFHSVSPPASLATPVPAPIGGRARITSLYGKLSSEALPGLTLSGGLRHDDHSRFGGKTLFEGGAVWAARSGTIVRASYGEAFKAPSLYQLFSEYGNVALAPERARGWEAGVEQRLLDGAVSLGATYFARRTRDQIIFNSCPFGGTPTPICIQPGTSLPRFGYYLNLARAEAHGIEAVGSAKVGRALTIDGNYSWTVSEDRSPGATNGLWLPRRPRHQANGSATYIWPFGLSTGATVRWSSRSYDNAANTTLLHGYTLVDLRAELPLTTQLTVFGRVENVFDKDYETVARYGTLGRSIYGGVRARF